MNIRTRSVLAAVVALTLSSNVLAAKSVTPWEQVQDPAAAGWSVERLAAARTKAEAIGSAAVMVVDSGRVIVAWGDVERRFRSASLRKSLISALYGNAIARKQIDLDATLDELGIDDIQPLSAEEKRATVRDLISARSGVYHPAAKVTRGQIESRPNRGSHAAGTFWFYNNWDFNVAGGILARATGTDPGQAFLREIAEPVGMQDIRAKDFYWEHEPRTTRHAAFDFRISSRDLARLGVLFLNGGTWNGRRVLPESWIKESVSPVTSFGDGSGYGYMWWVNPETSKYFGLSLAPGAKPSGSYAAEGAGAQILYVLPAKNLVIVHRGDTDFATGVDEKEALSLIAEIVRAKICAGNRRAALAPIHAEPFARALKPLVERDVIELDAKILGELPGTYVVSPEMTIEVFENDGRLFVSAPGRPDVQILQYQTGRFFARSVQLLIDVERGPDDEVVAIRAVFQGRAMRGVRTSPEKPKEAVPSASESGSE